MMGELNLRAEMFELLGALTNQVITHEQYRRLEHLLAESKQAREMYLDYLDLDFELGEMHTDVDVPEALRMLEHLAGQNMPSAPTRAGSGGQWLRYAVVIAATLCASVSVQLWFLPQGDPHEPTAKNLDGSSIDTREIQYVATLARAADCVWEGEQAVLPEGWRLAPGRIQLKRGVAMLRFDGGIELIAEGPCVLDVESGRSATLVSGKVVLRGDDISERFVLSTAAATFLDLGTEYAVEVDATGTTEVHVFDGIVVREAKDSEDASATEQLTAGRARRYAADRGFVGADVPLAGDRFVREVPFQGSVKPDVLGSMLAYEPFDYLVAELPSAETGDGGIGWTEPWRSAGNRPPVTVNPAENLPPASMGGPGHGGSLDQLGDGQVRRSLKTPVRLDTNGVYYVSYLFSSPGKEGGDKLRLSLRSSQATLPSEGSMKLHFGKYKSDFVFGYLAGRRFMTRLPLEKKAIYLLVAKIVACRKGPDQTFATVYRADEPIDREEPASWSLVSPPVHSDLVLDEVWISMIGNVRQRLDEIRIGSTWASVTLPLPPVDTE